MGSDTNNGAKSSGHGVDTKRRQFLLRATQVMCAAGVGAVAFTFLSALLPDASVKALGSTEVDISTLEPGKMITVLWRGKPVFILRRTPEQIANLQKIESMVRDPDSKDSKQPKFAQNVFRSLKPDIFVALGVCTHLGCVPLQKEDRFFCPCHGGHYDLAGRVWKGPPPTNLEIPPYKFIGDNTIKIG